MPKYDGSLNFDTKIDQKGFDKGTKKLSKSAKALGVAVAGIFSIGLLVRYGKQFSALANKQIEAEKRLEQIAKQVAKANNEQIQSLKDLASETQKYGVIGDEVLIMGQSQLASFALTTKQIEQLTGSLGDYLVAEKGFNATTQDAIQLSNNFGKAIATGQIGLLQRSGVVLTETQSKLFKMGNQAKRVSLLVDIMASNYGGLNEAMRNTPEGKIVALTNKFGDLKEMIGVNVTNALASMSGFLDKILDSAIAVVGQVNALFGAFSGTQSSQEVTTSISGSVKEQEKLTEEVENTNKALKGTVANFDQANVLQEETASGSGATAEAQTQEVKIETKVKGVEAKETAELSPLLQGLVNIVEDLKTIDLSPITTSFNNLMTSLEPFQNMALEGLMFLYENILLPLSTWTIESLIPTFLNLLAEALKVLAPIIEAMQPYFEPIIDWLIRLGEWTGQKIIDGLTWLTEKLKEFGTWIEENPEKFDLLVTLLSSLAIAIGIVVVAMGLFNIIMAIASGVVTVFSTIMAILTSPITLVILAIAALIAIGILLYKNWDVIKEKSLELWEKVKATFALWAKWVDDNVIKPIVKFFSEMWADIKAGVIAGWDTVIQFLVTIILWFYTNIISPIVDFFVTMWTDIKANINAGIEIAQAVFVKIVEWISKNVIDPIAEFFVELWDGIKTAFTKTFDAIKTAFKKIVNTYIGIWEGFFNIVIKGVNFLIDQLNKVSFKIPDWMGGGQFGFNIGKIGEIKIPRLATGAVVPPNSEFLATLGDNKTETEIVSPLSTMKQALKEAMEESGGGNVTINVSGELRAMIRYLKFELDKENNRQGTSMRVGGSMA